MYFCVTTVEFLCVCVWAVSPRLIWSYYSPHALPPAHFILHSSWLLMLKDVAILSEQNIWLSFYIFPLLFVKNSKLTSYFTFCQLLTKGEALSLLITPFFFTSAVFIHFMCSFSINVFSQNTSMRSKLRPLHAADSSWVNESKYSIVWLYGINMD